jgi:amino acid transporter
MYSIARDDVVPGAAFLRRVTRAAPVGGVVVTAVPGGAGLLLALDSTAIGSIVAFGTAAIYLSFLLSAVAADVARAARRAVSSGVGRSDAARGDHGDGPRVPRDRRASARRRYGTSMTSRCTMQASDPSFADSATASTVPCWAPLTPL